MTLGRLAHGHDEPSTRLTETDGPRVDRNRVATWVRTHQITAFLVWFFPVAWGIASIPLVAQRTLALDLPLEAFLIPATLLGLLLPALAITWLVDGQAGIDLLRRQVLRLRASIGWYALVLLAVPLTAVALATIVYGPPNLTSSQWLSAIMSGLIVQSAIGFVTINLWEETAWMGFVQVRLQARRGIWLGAVLTAGLFTLQHMPLFVDNGLAIVIILPMFFILAIPFRALLAWIFNRTSSLFLVGLLHAVSDGTGSGGFAPGFLPRLYDSGDISLFANLATVLVGLAVIVATRGRLGAQAHPAQRVADVISPSAVDPVS
jgi:membrane protease YdiL (CAAX protease family)